MVLNFADSLSWWSANLELDSIIAATPDLSKGRRFSSLWQFAIKPAYWSIDAGVLSIRLSKSAFTLKSSLDSSSRP